MSTTTIAILRDGTPVRIHLFDNPRFDVDGFLIEFTGPGIVKEVYRYHQHSEFKREDRKKPDLSGYYKEDLFLKYIQNVDPVPSLESLVKYNFEKVLATEGEEITVNTIDFDAPFDYFYDSKSYTFKLQLSPDKRGVANYRKLIMEDYRIVDSKVKTDGQIPTVVHENQSNTAGGYFFKKNFGDLISNWTITDAQKSILKREMSLIVFKIRQINRDIIPIIASNTNFFSKELDVANGIIDYDSFTDLEKLLFNFKRTWGYYYDTPLEGFPRPYKDNFEALFSSSSTYQDYLSYHSSLENFYQTCYRTKNLSYYPADDKIEYLLKILSPSALAVIPYNLIIKCIKQYLTFKLSQENQRVLVKLVMSIIPSHANDFLDFLLEKENGEKTNFQTIYDSLTDARLERYSFVNWFVDEQPNRKYFAFAIFELWKVSKYNLNYIRPGIVVPDPWPNFKGVDPDNYFYLNPKEYNEKNFLTFICSSTTSIVSSQQRFESAINDRKVAITEIYKNETNVGAMSQHKTGSIPFGSFHLYQQISFCGYESNLDLRVPTSATVPAFLFHFIEEYDRLADFDAGVSLAINLTADALLLYFTGGTSALKDLQYLKHTTKIGRALAGGIEPTEAVKIWRGLEGTSEAFTITAGTLTQINHYLITIENNEEKRKILEGIQKVFLTLTFIGAGVSISARAHAVREAGKVLDDIAALPKGVSHGLTVEMIDLLTTMKGNRAVTLTLFGDKLNNLNLGGATNYILIKYNSVFTDAQKLKFWNDFQHIDDPAFWKLLNSGKGANGAVNGSYLDNWINLSERGLQEAKFTEYICFQRRTDALIRYVDEPLTKPLINDLSYERKFVFIDTFGDELASFKNKPELINKWKKSYDDLVLRNRFTSLSNSKQIKWLESNGELPVDLYNKYLKADPDIILSWNKYSNEIDLINEINKFTKEEQFLFFTKFKHTDFVSFNRFKVDPSLLVIEKNYLKAYVAISEANYAFTTNLLEVRKIYKIQGEKLFLKVNEGFQITESSLKKNELKDIVLKSGFSHEDFPDLIILRDNISKKEMLNFMQNPKDKFGNLLNETWARDSNLPNNMLSIDKIKAVYKEFEPIYFEIHPWLEKRLNFHLEQRINKKWKIDDFSESYTGNIPGTHAEIRALNELLWKLEANGTVINNDILTKVLGYNKNYSSGRLMPRCGDCLFLSRDIKMIISN